MAIVRQIRTTNPDDPTLIDATNPLAKGMYIDIDPRYGLIEGIQGLTADIVAGVSVVSGTAGREFDFSGSSTGILWNANPVYQNLGDMTILVEASFDSITGDNPFHSLGVGGETEASNFLSYFTINSSGGLQLFWEQGAGGNVAYTATPNTGASAGELHQYALTRSVGATSSGTFYYDGEELDTYSGLTNPSGGSSTQMIVGSNFYSAGTFQTDTNGRTKVRCFDRVLKGEEIRAYFDNWWQVLQPETLFFPDAVAPTGRIMSSLTAGGGLAGQGGLAGTAGGLAG